MKYFRTVFSICLVFSLFLTSCKISDSSKEENIKEIVAKVSDKNFLIRNEDGEYEEVFLDGVNIGATKSGYFPGEFAITEMEYLRWFKYISDMNIQVIRVYVNQSPNFYNALYKFNELSERPLYLVQGVYVNEEYIEKTLDAYGENGLVYNSFCEDIKNVIDMIHGNLNLPPKKGYASGVYKKDVSQWVIGYILGIEWYADFVIGTNNANTNKTGFNGKYVKTKNASPFEVFLAEISEYTINYEEDNYGTQRPIAISNWPTTDPLIHKNEPIISEDMVSVDVEHILPTKNFEAGFFASYHIYPCYPDFLRYEKEYISGESPNPYRAYVEDINNYHTMPVLIAEYGISTSRGIAHINQVTGMSQGMASEEIQADWIISLNKDIRSAGCMGAFIFSWQDESFKKTWNTASHEDAERRPYWQNVQNPEENYGLLAFDSDNGVNVTLDGEFSEWRRKHIVYKDDNFKLYAQSDYAYLYLMVEPKNFNFENDALYIPLDVISNQGNTTYKSLSFSDGADFLIRINGKSNSTVLVDSYYDVFQYEYSELSQDFEVLPGQTEINSGYFNNIYLAMSYKQKLPEDDKTVEFERYDTGALKYGSTDSENADYLSYADFYSGGSKIEIRIPWGLIGFSDPSTKSVIADFHKTAEFEIQETDGIKMGVCSENYTGKVNLALYTWENWEIPIVKERLKDSYYILKDYFNNN